MRLIRPGLVILLSLAASTRAADLAALAGRSIAAYDQIQAIDKEKDAAVGDRDEHRSAISRAMDQLKKPPLSAEELKKLDDRIATTQQSIERLKKQDPANSSLRYYENNLRAYDLKKEAGSIQGEEARKAHNAKLKERRDALDAEIKRISKPFNDRIAKAREPVRKDNTPLGAALSPFFKAPEKLFPGAKVAPVNATSHMAFGGSKWKTADGKSIAWAHIRIRSAEEAASDAKNEKLDGKYPIRTISKSQFWFWAGHFLIAFIPQHDDIKDPAKLKQHIGEFIDLAGLAAIQPKTP